MGFADNKENIKYFQTYPYTSNSQYFGVHQLSDSVFQFFHGHQLIS